MSNSNQKSSNTMDKMAAQQEQQKEKAKQDRIKQEQDTLRQNAKEAEAQNKNVARAKQDLKDSERSSSGVPQSHDVNRSPNTRVVSPEEKYQQESKAKPEQGNKAPAPKPLKGMKLDPKQLLKIAEDGIADANELQESQPAVANQIRSLIGQLSNTVNSIRQAEAEEELRDELDKKDAKESKK